MRNVPGGWPTLCWHSASLVPQKSARDPLFCSILLHRATPTPDQGKLLEEVFTIPAHLPTYHCASMYMPTSIVSQYLKLSNVITMIWFSSLILPWSYQLSGYLLIHCGKASLIIQSHVVGYLGCSWRLWNSLQEFSPPQQVGHSDITLLQMHPGSLKTFLGLRDWSALLNQFCLTHPGLWHSDAVQSSFHLVPCVLISWHSGIFRIGAESVPINWGVVIPSLHCWSHARASSLIML